jgi:hypothetical protein
MEKAIRHEDGTMISPAEWAAIKATSRLVKIDLLSLPQPRAGGRRVKDRPKTKTFFRSYYPKEWFAALNKMERLQPLLVLCAAQWKADHVLGNSLLTKSSNMSGKGVIDTSDDNDSNNDSNDNNNRPHIPNLPTRSEKSVGSKRRRRLSPLQSMPSTSSHVKKSKESDTSTCSISASPAYCNCDVEGARAPQTSTNFPASSFLTVSRVEKSATSSHGMNVGFIQVDTSCKPIYCFYIASPPDGFIFQMRI